MEPKPNRALDAQDDTAGALLHNFTGTAMIRTRRLTYFIGVAGLLLSGCDEFARDARRDFGRLTAQSPFSSSRPARSPTPAASPAQRRDVAAVADPKVAAPRELSAPSKDEIVSPLTSLVGQSEGDIRARFGAPTSEEERTPGKTWRYRNGQCALDVSLYPDVQTRQFTTLAYEVRSNDNTDQGKQLCLGQLQSRARLR
jgi:hypothetical protein